MDTGYTPILVTLRISCGVIRLENGARVPTQGVSSGVILNNAGEDESSRRTDAPPMRTSKKHGVLREGAGSTNAAGRRGPTRGIATSLSRAALTPLAKAQTTLSSRTEFETWVLGAGQESREFFAPHTLVTPSSMCTPLALSFLIAARATCARTPVVEAACTPAALPSRLPHAHRPECCRDVCSAITIHSLRFWVLYCIVRRFTWV